jgi:riboflavin kinase / FMN adenylyltransferase
MNLFNSIESLIKSTGRKTLFLALGNFDGVHVGHQQLIQGIVRSARKQDGVPVVVTFDPHPLQYFAKTSGFKKIDDRTIRQRLMASMGVEAILEFKFDARIAELSAHQFLEGLTCHRTIGQISVGADFHFGKARLGDATLLREFCQKRNIETVIIDPVVVGSFTASSSKIREWLRIGEVESASKMLGRNFSMRGKIVHGRKLGRSLGFPTANIDDIDQLVPAQGVYSGELKLIRHLSFYNDMVKPMNCVINIGSRPTFDEIIDKIAVEAHVFDSVDSELDLYGETVELVFFHRIRDEKKFPEVDLLKKQIKLDIEIAKKYLV